jgi:hypothetical protein
LLLREEGVGVVSDDVDELLPLLVLMFLVVLHLAERFQLYILIDGWDFAINVDPFGLQLGPLECKIRQHLYLLFKQLARCIKLTFLLAFSVTIAHVYC